MWSPSRNKVEKAESATADLTIPPVHRNRLGLPSHIERLAAETLESALNIYRHMGHAHLTIGREIGDPA